MTLTHTKPNSVNSEKTGLFKLAYGLSVFTILYNLLEGLVSTWLGFSDDSLALFGFGADSFIEMISGFGILMMIARIQTSPESPRSRHEKTALRITGFSFYVLVTVLLITSGYQFISGKQPETTFWGVVISLVSIAVMGVLVALKLNTGKKLDSDAIIADARCTLVCIYMSVVLLISSGLYHYFKIPYTDSLGALGLAYFSFTEGRECFEKARSEKHCDC